MPSRRQVRRPGNRTFPGQVVLVLQGGGPLGSYQAGVYQALHEAGVEPDWFVGTSIGAVNASLIAGNAREKRLPRLKEFWKRIERNPIAGFRTPLPGFEEHWSYWVTLTREIPGFFKPNPMAHAGLGFRLGADSAGFYSTAPLEDTLVELVDFDVINQGKTRLTVGAARVRTSEMRYFDREAVTPICRIKRSFCAGLMMSHSMLQKWSGVWRALLQDEPRSVQLMISRTLSRRADPCDRRRADV